MTLPRLRRPVPGISNLRDLGGYAVQGGSLRWHTLYRSSEISATDNDTLRQFQTLGIRTLCDFRDDKQKQKVPIDLPFSARANTITTPISVSVLIRSALSGEKLTGTSARKILADIYRSLVLDHADAYKLFFNSLLDLGNYPLVFLCVAGKDRTGLAAALLLTALGASRDAIFDDYLLSNTYWEMPTDVLTEEDDDVRNAVFTADSQYLDAAFTAISEHYGSTERLLHDVLGLTPGHREQLLAYLVE
ncbi:MAG TPA: tyrosine-protein phosphatase [Gammaproteobacteria bacterium]|jgi:protein-tyrosine phosphatase|nr:tyrosine-protein phosphatase [Gammaproteobacteria bacterium]RTZ63557.1 MAG: hypothetical protein DSZ34_08795 [Gammaproteobacteria bacterium]HBK75573.1 hypothetical protein [Gammaproteobacteria bacterium]HIM96531.1 tyrosine-protein phosphatase [Gammaproteobacteria bacterium]HIO17840.1 tyrosine-protein phosphatase [Gammaproteobacteria bacterium]|tara:strand:+ start:915 stop:1655 length:741 start_codon:yes stop_codon:yes gene_type:complete